jgi:AraC family transcriptional regulator of adaptative response / DNA-3-methyladenine glycosylase II
MNLTDSAFYNAYLSRDPRFDGVFYMGVITTGVYCRPICTAKTPKAINCRFFNSAESAEKNGFRPCLLCRPELAPGNAPVDDGDRIANLICAQINEGILDEKNSLEAVALHLELSPRQIRRILQKKLGVSPIELVQTRRLLLAKQLLTESTLSIIDVAFASGFSSLRRFNDAFSTQYGMPPTRLRKGNTLKKLSSSESITLQLIYRPPYDWDGILRFLKCRALTGIEYFEENGYCRTLQKGDQKGWVKINHRPEKNALIVEIAHSLIQILPSLLDRLRHVFDLSASPNVIGEHLQQDPLLEKAVSRNPGLRVPGAFDGFELAVRAILGQQITVKAATTLAGRFVEAFGEPIETPYPFANRLCPTPKQISTLQVSEIAKLGIIQSRASSIINIAKEIASGRLKLEAGLHPERVIKQLIALPGIGPWTAHYIAMRALRWPDAFPKEDSALRHNLGGITGAEAETLSQAWRPWRSYATLHLWQNPIKRRE